MKLSTQSLLLSMSALSMPALAEEQGFDNFLLTSPSIVSPSQYYQVNGGRFEALAGLANGSYEDKAPGSKAIDVSGQNLGAGYAQALNGQIVLGADVLYSSTKFDDDGNSEFSETEIKPTVAFSLTPIFTLGANVHVVSGKDKDSTGSTSYSRNTFSVGGTLHQDLWEATLALTTSNKDDKKPSASDPQRLTVHGRYRILPVLALGARFDQADYPGIEQTGESLETESSYSVILESGLSEQANVEVAFQSISNSEGLKDTDATVIFLSGAYKLAPNMELGAQIRLQSLDADTVKANNTRYALTFTSRN